jgi:16S rRNA (cytosine1402-N4)-methyltransferase
VTGEQQSYPHIPVLVSEVLHWLLTDPHGVYVDGTIGLGGHSSTLLQHLSADAILIGIDADPDALDATARRLEAFPQQIFLIQSNFSHLPAILTQQRIAQVDGILLDLGLSSLQIDVPERGFSYMQEGPLDMRFSPHGERSAAQFLNTAQKKEIENVIREFGEERKFRVITQAILQSRPLETTIDLRRAIESVTPDRFLIKTLARVFQAIRIYVNRELEVLGQTLRASLDLLKPGGRIVVIAYHSLEDRIVKQFFKEAELDCICPPELPVCVCDKEQELKILTKNVVTASRKEIEENSRARSAKLRAAERV